MSDRIRIDFVYRSIRSGYFSILKVFQPIERVLKDNINHLEAPCYRFNVWSVCKNLSWMYAQRDKHTVYHLTGAMEYLALALRGCHTVMTIHDMSTLNIPGNKLKKYILRKFWLELPLKCASQITCISNTTRDALLREFPEISPQKVSMIYNPLSPEFRYHPKEFDALCPVILHVGTTPNKNLQRVCQALRGISCRLVVVGRLSRQDLENLHENKISYLNKVSLSDEEMLQEYRQADIISFPSLYEGFGMPVIEGQATGRVVLTSHIAPLTEISGNAVCYVNPESVEDIRRGFDRLISDSFYRDELIKGGLENVRRFDVDQIAMHYRKLYEKVLRNH